jgi:hypothetical protein
MVASSPPLTRGLDANKKNGKFQREISRYKLLQLGVGKFKSNMLYVLHDAVLVWPLY